MSKPKPLQPYAVVDALSGVARYFPREDEAETAARYQAFRRAEAEAVLDGLPHCRTRELAIHLIDHALLIAWIAGRNAQAMAASRQPTKRTRRKPSRTTR